MKVRNFSHGIMFHHFHDHKSPIVGQGSISASEFSGMLDWLSDRYTILSADEYTYKFTNGLLVSSDICLTFDDALLCQAEIAAPVLEKKGLSAFFFVYSSPFLGEPDYLEMYRYFRVSEFDSIEEFYRFFFNVVQEYLGGELVEAEKGYDRYTYLKGFSFYTDDDRWFRYLRDVVLGSDRYAEVMGIIMALRKFEPESMLSKLWMNNQHLAQLHAAGHVLGLHSYSHPTTIDFLSRDEQEIQYVKNYVHLREVAGVSPIAMAHPCGRYNENTLRVLEGLGVSIGFRSDCKVVGSGKFEVPREDHANIFKEMMQ